MHAGRSAVCREIVASEGQRVAHLAHTLAVKLIASGLWAHVTTVLQVLRAEQSRQPEPLSPTSYCRLSYR